MNTLIQTLNDWGENFLTFAWPMLWQSSLLIVIVFALDFLFARKIRPAIRHMLWMVVLIKLVLPPTLALPTSATWWLWTAKPPMEAPAVSTSTIVSDEPVPEPDFVPQTIPIPMPPPPRLERTGWMLLASGVISLGLFIWVAINWLGVLKKIRTVPASTTFDEALEHAWQSTGLHRRLRLPVKLIDDRQSPAVYGLFRPVILLPRLLAEKLSPAQLRAVLLHEAIHVRRGDVWVNCGQTLLQIAYWWHPLLWLANARIRRLREEAVDDAVMTALQADANTYAPTLLEVAKFAFRRPLASLGLVGILESRSALRQRIERLVDFRPPHKAGVTFLALCGIFVFSAVALPMGQGPAPTDKTSGLPPVHKTRWPDPQFDGIRMVNLIAQFVILDDSQLRAAVPSLADKQEPVLISSSQNIAHLIQQLFKSGGRIFGDGWEGGIGQAPISGGTQYYRIDGSNNFTNGITGAITALTTNLGGSFSNILCGYDVHLRTTQPDWTPMNLTLRALTRDKGASLQMDVSFPATTAPNRHSEVTLPTGDAMLWITTPPNLPGKRQVIILYPWPKNKNEAATNPVISDSVRQAILKLSRIYLNVSYSNAPLSEVIDDLHEKSIVTNSENSGINFLFNPGGANILAAKPAIDPATGLSAKAMAVYPMLNATNITINLTLTHVNLMEVLNAICMVANHPVEYSVENYGVVFSQKKRGIGLYEGQTFKVDTNAFTHFISVQEKTDLISYILTHGANAGDFGDESAPFRPILDYFKTLGVNISPPKTLFYNDRSGSLYVYATPQDLDVIDRFVAGLNDPRLAFLNAMPSYDAAVRKLEMRSFGLSTNVFLINMRMKTGQTDVTTALRQLFSNAGVDLSPPKSFFWKDHTRGGGMLYVYATPQDLDIVEQQVSDLNDPRWAFWNVTPSSAPVERKYAADAWGEVGKKFYEAGNFDEAMRDFIEAMKLDPGNKAANDQYNRDLKTIMQKLSGQPFNQAESEHISSELLNVVLDEFGPYDQAPLRQVFKDLNQKAIASGADFKISFSYMPPATNEILVNLPLLKNASLETVYDKILEDSSHPLKYSVTDRNVVFTTDGLETRYFYVSTPAFIEAVRQQTSEGALLSGFRTDAAGKQTGAFDVVSSFKDLVSEAGVNLSPPKSIFLSDGKGILWVHASRKDLGIIETIINGLDCPPQQIHIKARFIEVPKSFLADNHSLPAGVTNGAGLLTASEAKEFLKQLESNPDCNETAEPEATTLAGRQLQMRATIVQPIVTNYTYNISPGDKMSLVPQATPVETGPILDVVPMIFTNSDTINLGVIASQIKFFGYADASKAPRHYATNTDGQTITLPAALPIFHVYEASTQRSLYDGQTLVLSPLSQSASFPPIAEQKSQDIIAAHIQKVDPKKEKTVLFCLVTATLIDSGGNRIHSDQQMSFAQNGFPPKYP